MKKNLLGGAAVVLILVGVSAYSYFTGAEIGGTCQWNDDCKGNLYGKFGSQCLDMGDGKGGFCTTTCKAVGDCPSGWSCDGVDYYENDVKKGVNQVCVKSAPTNGQPAAAPAPGAAPATTPAPAPR
jgi:hypothetical protein